MQVSRGLALASFALLGFAATASAETSTTVADPVGDTRSINRPGSTPAYLDAVSVVVEKEGDVVTFSTQLAAPVPAQPTLPSGMRQIWWFWAIDADATRSPTGYPRALGLSFPPEFAVVVSWDGTQFKAFVVDRRPTLVGKDPDITPTQFSIGTDRVSAFVDAVLLDDPASFGWRAATRAWHGPPGTEGLIFTDYVPTPDGPWFPWPSS